MKTLLRSRPARLAAAVTSISAVVATLAVVGTAPPSVAASLATYTVTVDSIGTYPHPTDTGAGTYIDKDGTFYFQQSASLYGATQHREWEFFTGTNFETATRSPISDAVNPNNWADKNSDTTWRCNNSPTGVESTYAPSTGSYSQRNFCTLIGVWVDPDTGDWYGLVHNEFTPQPFGDGLHYDSIDYAVSKDQGRTWVIRDHAITSPYSTKRNDTAAFPNQTYHYGTGDQRLFVDAASGYFYVFYGSRIVDKAGTWRAFYGHVARSPISSKMAKGSWQKWYGGSWSQAGVGGRESNMVPISTNANGYTPTTAEYNPANTGTASQQIAAGKMPPTSPLFVMNIAYNAHLRLYIGTPQAVDQSGNAPQEIYATDNLATQKWFKLGDTGGYRNASWYRWFLDTASKTGSTIVGKTFRSYCSFGCANNTSGQYINATITSSTATASPVDTSRSYTIGVTGGRVLAQAGGSTATTSVSSATGSNAERWAFHPTGDGAYRIVNVGSGNALGVTSSANSGRAWGAKPTVTAGSTVGRQWWVVPSGSTYRLVNRYSGLVIALSADSTRTAETTPLRTWSNATGNAVGGTRTAAEQTIALTAVGTAPPPTTLDGTHTLAASGKALDNPGHSTTAGTQLITWSPNGGANQTWVFTSNPDGTYQIKNGESNLCVDVADYSTAAGGKIVQWTCTGGANQRWAATRLADGTYALKSQSSGLLLTTASTTDGALVTQQSDTGSALQRWIVG
ncbi:RICIN domain-containing protein [Actinokineospora xionganensis]|uniref:RICIN domain-containing protein n=1 Tax=Actinokineospora xionganensis TaxID=2684470 RepID=A0ABR7LEM0_9PSEU|nr:RICIN domain-containing protein [Actinokineospora xionganensis]MBC6451038.1 RICIN domain-containing protein [Actinokineospora xionganensis]